MYFNIILLTEQSWPLTAQLQMSALFLARLLHKTIFTYHFISEDPLHVEDICLISSKVLAMF